MSNCIERIRSEFPFDWADINLYRNSNAFRKEIYLKSQNDLVEGLISLFHNLFGDFRNNLIIFNNSWWDFCLETWDINNNEYDYNLENKSIETKKYLELLIENQIQKDYSGCCICNDWDNFLRVTLDCIIKHKAPYSPIFCDVQHEYFFYFHHTGSIGIYFKNENDALKQILFTSYDKYLVEG